MSLYIGGYRQYKIVVAIFLMKNSFLSSFVREFSFKFNQFCCIGSPVE